jgi:post-segregation antitoxin (ccd killing protein)
VELNAVTTKTSTTVYLNSNLTDLAKELGLNISKTCENALKLAINRLQGLNLETTDASPQFGAKIEVVDRAGFEPAASALRTRRSYRADLPALLPVR